MRKFVCFLGILLSLALVALGAVTTVQGVPQVKMKDNGLEVLVADFSGDTASNSSFGADFYTYSYRATRYAANNVDALGDYLEKVISTGVGAAFMVAGLFGLLLSVYGLRVACANKQQQKLLQQIADELRSGNSRQQDVMQRILEKEIVVKLPAQSASVAQPAPVAKSVPASAAQETWICRICAHGNRANDAQCAVCGEPR